MPKFRKKPDARIFEPTQFKGLANKGVCACTASPNLHVHTIHAGQVCDLEDGDWVMPEPDGIHFYPIKPDIFDATYEPVETSKAEGETKW